MTYERWGLGEKKDDLINKTAMINLKIDSPSFHRIVYFF